MDKAGERLADVERMRSANCRGSASRSPQPSGNIEKIHANSLSRACHRRAPHLPRSGGRLIPFTKAHACGNDFLIVPKRPPQVRLAPIYPAPLRAQHRHRCGRRRVFCLDWSDHGLRPHPSAQRRRFDRGDQRQRNPLRGRVDGRRTRLAAGRHPRDRDRCRAARLPNRRVAPMAASPSKSRPAWAYPSSCRKRSSCRQTAVIDGVEVSTGNPHFVILVDRLTDFISSQRRRHWDGIGEEICLHPDFPQPDQRRICAHRATPTEIEIRIFERGVGPTISPARARPPRQPPRSHYVAAFAAHSRRSRRRANRAWNGPGTELTSPARLLSSPVARHGEMQRLAQTARRHAGAGISVIAPASSAKPERVEAGMKRYAQLGYCAGARPQASGARATLFCRNAASSAWPICTRPLTIANTGAVHGSPRRLRIELFARGLDFDAHSPQHPKPFFAYSDLTGMQLASAR